MVEMNKAYMMGNLTRTPELKYTKQGLAVSNLRMAMNRPIFGSPTEGGQPTKKREETTYLTVVAWGRQAERACEYLTKGSPILVEGFLQSREWEKNGVQHSVLEVVAERIIYLARNVSINNDGSVSDVEEPLDGEGEEGRG